MRTILRIITACLCIASALAAACMTSSSAATGPQGADNFGPYNSTFLEGGIGQSRPLASDAPLLAPGAPWSLSGWMRLTVPATGTVVIAAVGNISQIGNTDGGECRCLNLQEGRLALRLGKQELSAPQPVDLTQWHAVAATYDGTTARLYVDGRESAAGAAMTSRAAPLFNLAPEESLAPEQSAQPEKQPGSRHFGGSLAHFTLHPNALTASEVASLFQSKPDFDLIVFNSVGVGWPWQASAWRGLLEPQDPWTLPHAVSLPSTPVASPAPASQPLASAGRNLWTLGAWKLIEAGKVGAAPAQ